MRERWSILHDRYAEECKRDAAAKDLPTEFLDSRNGVLGAQQIVKRKGDDASHADMLSRFHLNTTQGQRDAARLRSSSGGPAGAFLTAIPGGHMTLGNSMLCLCGTASGTTFPLTWPRRRANAVQELLPKQIMRWSATRSPR